MAAECANWNLWAGRLRNYDRVRGGRLNGVDPLKFAPRWVEAGHGKYAASIKTMSKTPLLKLSGRLG